MSEPIQIIIGDSTILYAFAEADELDILLSLSDNVDIAITDYVELELTHLIQNLESVRIAQFIGTHPNRVSVMKTAYGEMFKHVYMLWQRFNENTSLREVYVSNGFAAPEKPILSLGDSTTMLTRHFIESPPENTAYLIVNDSYFTDGDTSFTYKNFNLISLEILINWLKQKYID